MPQSSRRDSRAAQAAMLVAMTVAIQGCSWERGLAANGEPTPRSVATAFVDVNVIPMNDERVLPHQTVLVQDGKVSAVGAVGLIAIPADATRIAGVGRYLMPGLADMHAHLGYRDGTAEQKRTLVRQELLLFLATGVTLVRNMHGIDDVHLPIREEVRSGSSILSPRFYTTGPILEGPNGNGGSLPVQISDAAAAEAEVKRQAELGYDAVKVYNELPAEAYQAIVAAAAKYDIPVVGHVPFTSRLQAALDAHQHTIEHVNGYDVDQADPAVLEIDLGRNVERYQALHKLTPARLAEMAAATQKAGVGNVPTLVVTDFLANDEKRAALLADARMRFVPPFVRAHAGESLDKMFPAALKAAIDETLYKRKEIVKALSDAGAPLMTGSDTSIAYVVPGFTVIDEIRLLIEAGLTPYQALRAATVVPAQFVALGQAGGTVEIGKNADLILIDGNPLEDPAAFWKLDGVMIAGRWLSRADLDRRLEALAASYTSNE